MANVTAADVHNVAFRKPPLGRRGYDEEEVDNFLDAVEHTIAALTEEIASLRAQLDHGVSPLPAPTQGSSEGAILVELTQIKVRLARLEAAMERTGAAVPTGNPLFGNG